MKSVFCLMLFSFSLTSFAASDWNVVAETVRCKSKLQVLAKEGENFVYVVDGNEKTQLFSEDKSPYQKNAPRAVVFQNDKDPKKGYVFTLPSGVEGNPPKLDVTRSGAKDHCRMNLKI